MEVTCDMPEDVVLLHKALSTIHNSPVGAPSTLNLDNAGTAFRFLTAYCAQLPGCEVVLDGCKRMYHRPIGPLVDALRSFGAKIDYLGEDGFPPLHINGITLHNNPQGTPFIILSPVSSQFASALELVGIPCDAPASPYITMTREIVKHYPLSTTDGTAHRPYLEKDWSGAAFWYEYVAIHGGEIEMPGLNKDSLQGDKIVADIFELLGVSTLYIGAGARVINNRHSTPKPQTVNINFSACPDLYPAVAMTCKVLGYKLQATGLENLRYKESDRLASVEAMVNTPKGQIVITEHDHRIAMAAMVAGYRVDDEDCVRKSYPDFKNELCKLLSHAEA